MHGAAWVKLFRHIPLEQQANLMLVTTGGTEIAIQGFLRIDPECLALRGRLAGSTDGGRVFFVPYSHIDYFGFQQSIKETEFHEMFGNLEIQDTATESTPSLRGPLAIKSSVLEKFRSRTNNPGAQPRPPLDE